MIDLLEIEPEYVYMTIPAEYVCVYHRILAMMADYGEELLKDCKASCTQKNYNIVECFNMFNSAVAARKLGKDSLANTIIKYVKAKINQIYKGIDNSTSFVFPVDENGELKAFVSCGERPIFEISTDDMMLYEHKLGNGFPETFALSAIDFSENYTETSTPVEEVNGIKVSFDIAWKDINGDVVPAVDLRIEYPEGVNENEVIISYFFDDREINSFDEIRNVEEGGHKFALYITCNGTTSIFEKHTIFDESQISEFTDILTPNLFINGGTVTTYTSKYGVKYAGHVYNYNQGVFKKDVCIYQSNYIIQNIKLYFDPALINTVQNFRFVACTQPVTYNSYGDMTTHGNTYYIYFTDHNIIESNILEQNISNKNCKYGNLQFFNAEIKKIEITFKK